MKIAISVPDDVFEAGEHLARQLGLSRSQLYSDALTAYLSERGAAAVTARLNDIYSREDSTLDAAIERLQLSRLANEAW
jgi:metal-responsive CopG/Arc/MetJ family transcriptional regulator